MIDLLCNLDITATQAFSHFTWEESKKQILIVDVQGVGDVWTDPQIHSVNGVGYGKGNMGMRGITAFLNNHRCNAMCKALKLPPTGRKPAKVHRPFALAVSLGASESASERSARGRALFLESESI
jgi:hypothetical protein